MPKRLFIPSLAAGALLFSANLGFGNLVYNGGFEQAQPSDHSVEFEPYFTSAELNNFTTNNIGPETGTIHQWVAGRESIGDPLTAGPATTSHTEWFSLTAPAIANVHPVQEERSLYNPTAAASGNFAVELHSSQSDGHTDYDIVYMEQRVDGLVIGQTYQLTFKFADTDDNSIDGGTNPNDPAALAAQHAKIQVSFRSGNRFAPYTPITSAQPDSRPESGSTVVVDPVGSTTATFTSGRYNRNLDANGDPILGTEQNFWHDGTVNFTATSTTETIRFLNFASTNGNNMSIDQVDLEAVPEPATLGAAALLVGGIGFFERKRLKGLGLFKKFRA